MTHRKSRKSPSSSLPYAALETRQVLSAYFPASMNGTQTLGDPTAFSPYELNDTFELESLPSADKTIYLDFDGHHSVNNSWQHDIVFPSYSRDANTSSFSNSELLEIQQHFQRVAEDFLLFNINVTTKDPGLDALRRSNFFDQTFGVRVVVSQNTDDFTDGGGIAFLNSFNDSVDNPVFVFNQGAANGAVTSSHEAGHALGLEHKGLNTSEYHPGTGSGETRWGPILGAPFGNTLSQWTDGGYTGATLVEDELSIITGSSNGVSFRADDVGSTLAAASSLSFTPEGTAFDWGIVERNTDQDFYEFTIDSGELSLAVNSFQEGANLDVLATLYDQSGNILSTSNPLNDLDANISSNLDAGTYFLSVEGTGRDGRYSDYGSLGFYTIEGAFESMPEFVDLTVSELTITQLVDGSVNYSFEVNNEGTVDLDFDMIASSANTPIRLELFGSTDQVTDNPNDTVLSTIDLTGVINAGQSASFSGTLSAGSLLPEQTYLGVFVDSDEILSEQDELNNTTVAPLIAIPGVDNFVRDAGNLARPDLLSTIQVTFSADVIISEDSLLVLNDSTGGTPIDLTDVVFEYDSSSQTAEWDFSATEIAAAFYTFSLDANLITSALGGVKLDGNGDGNNGDNYVTEVYVAIPGDANLDGDVDVLDFDPVTFLQSGDGATIFSNAGTLTGATWAEGDFNGDGDVDVSDFHPVTFENTGDAAVLLANLGRNVRPVAQTVFVASTSASPFVSWSLNQSSMTTEETDGDSQATAQPTSSSPAAESYLSGATTDEAESDADVAITKANADFVFSHAHDQQDIGCRCPACLGGMPLANVNY